jgi:hypothetical protein
MNAVIQYLTLPFGVHRAALVLVLESDVVRKSKGDLIRGTHNIWYL